MALLCLIIDTPPKRTAVGGGWIIITCLSAEFGVFLRFHPGSKVSEELPLQRVAAGITDAPLVFDSPSHPLHIKPREPRSERLGLQTDGGAKHLGTSRSGI